MHRPTLSEVLSRPGLTLMVSPPRNDPELFLAAVEAGAEAVKAHLNVEHRASGTRFGSFSEEEAELRGIADAVGRRIPLGLMPGADRFVSRDELERARDLGFGFVDAYLEHLPAWVLTSGVEVMAAVGAGDPPSLVQGLAGYPVEAVEASFVAPSAYGQVLSLADLIRYRALAEATSQPVVVPSQKRLEPGDLQALVDCGIRGVLLGVHSLGDSPESFRERLAAFVRARDGLHTR